MRFFKSNQRPLLTPHHVVIRSERLTLDNFRDEDFDELIKHNINGIDYSPFDLFAAAKAEQTLGNLRGTFHLAIRLNDKSGPSLVGFVRLHIKRKNNIFGHGHYEIGETSFSVSRHFQQRDIGTEAYAMMSMLAMMRGCIRLERKIDKENTPSLRNARRLGFRKSPYIWFMEGGAISHALPRRRYFRMLPKTMRHLHARLAKNGVKMPGSEIWLQQTPMQWRKSIEEVSAKNTEAGGRPLTLRTKVGPFRFEMMY